MAATSEPFRIGLLGHGTVGAAFAELLADRADAVAADHRPAARDHGVLTRSRGTSRRSWPARTSSSS